MEHTLCEWLSAAHGVYVLQQPRILLGIVDKNGLAGVFVITWRNDTTAELHVYGTVSPGVVRQMFEIVFRELGLYRLEVRTERANKQVRKAAPKYGFSFEGCARGYYGKGRDALVFGMSSDNCRWLKRHGLTVQNT